MAERDPPRHRIISRAKTCNCQNRRKNRENQELPGRFAGRYFNLRANGAVESLPEWGG